MAQAPFSEVSPISSVSLGRSQEDRESVAINNDIRSMSSGFSRLTSHLIEELGTTELLEDLDGELCNATPLGTCLRGCGRYWSLKADINVEDVTVPSSYYDAFVSHEWGSSGLLKVLTLTMTYNLRAATVATFLGSLLLGVLRVFELLPDDERTVAIGYAIFFVFICFWQRIRECFCKPHLMFVDKLCIEQKDAREKTKGILSLAAFLKRSKTLVLLWSPLYFQRLWCTFELVSFLREREVGVEVLPVKMVVLIAHLNVTWQLLRITMKIMNSSEMVATEITSWFTILSLLGLVVLPFYHYLGLKIIADISELPQQLKTFQIQEAKCTCCSRNHVDPETGAEIACDRKLVLYTLKKWQTSQDEDYLQAFNALVRQNLLSIFVDTLEGSFLPLSFYIKMAICANAPWLSDLVSELYAELQVLDPNMGGFDLSFCIINKVLDFLNVYLVMILLARSSFTLWRFAVLLRHHVPLWLLSFCLIIPMLPLGVALVTLAYFPLYMSPKTSPLPFGCFILMVLAVIAVFSRPCCRKTYSSRVSLRSISSQESSLRSTSTPIGALSHSTVNSTSQTSGDDESTFSI